MDRVKVGPPRPTGNRDCREGPAGSWFWWDEIDQDYQDVDENGHPVGPVYTLTEWVNSAEPCEP